MVRRIVIPLFIVMAIFSFTSAKAAITIVGQNNPAVDIQAIQKAVDQGGIVNLKGTFDFGNEGRVNITKDVKIVGEMDNKGSPMTKIKGGFWTFFSPLPVKLPPEAPGPKITIQNIHFDGALWIPIHLAYSSGTTISNNKITNVRPKLMDEPVFGKTGLNRQQGIACLSTYVQPMETRKYIPNAITGNLIIEDNDIKFIPEFLRRLGGDPTLAAAVDTIIFPVTLSAQPAQGDAITAQMVSFIVPIKTLETPLTT